MRKMENYVGSDTKFLRQFMVTDESQCEQACLMDSQCVMVSSIKIWVTYRCILYEGVDLLSLRPNENGNLYSKICRNGKFLVLHLINVIS